MSAIRPNLRMASRGEETAYLLSSGCIEHLHLDFDAINFDDFLVL